VVPSNIFHYRDGEAVVEPNIEITKFEDKIVNDPVNLLGAMTLDQSLPRRPAYGTEGTAVVLRANYFDLTLKNEAQMVYRYDVQIDESGGLSRKKIHRYLELLLEQVNSKGIYAATDYASILITNTKLELLNDQASFKIIIHDRLEAPFPAAVDGEDPERQAARKRRTRTLNIKYAMAYSLAELYSFVNAEQHGALYTANGDLIQAMNIIFGRAANLQSTIANVGQTFYPFTHTFGNHPNAESTNLGHGLVALRGYFSSVRPAPQRILVNLNVCSGAFYEPGVLRTLMVVFMQGKDPDNPFHLRELSKFIKGLKVVTKYTKETDSKGDEKVVHKVNSVLGLATVPKLGANCQDVTFSWVNEAGDPVTSNVEQYFKRSLSPSFLN
jgi:eukaryotic translation initiation factor 2C